MPTPKASASRTKVNSIAQSFSSSARSPFRPHEAIANQRRSFEESSERSNFAGYEVPSNLANQWHQAVSFGHQLGQPSAGVSTTVQAKADDHQEQVNPANFQGPPEGAGSTLPLPVQQKMEAAFGTSFSDVQVHETPKAQSIGAAAYTQGTHIYFAPGQYDPDSLGGQSLLGHELTHVVQQRAGRVATPSGTGVPINTNPGLEAEADRLGAQAARGQIHQASSGLLSDGLAAPSAGTAPVQCGLFSKIGRGLKKVGKGIGKGIKSIGKKVVDVAPSLYNFGLDAASAIPGPIGQAANGARALVGAEDSFMSSMIGGGNFGEALSTSAGSFLGGMGLGGGGMDFGSMLGGLGGGGMGGMGNNIMDAIGSGSGLLKDLFD